MGQDARSPGGPLSGARSTQVRPETGVPLEVATTVTVTVSPEEIARGETSMLRLKLDAVPPPRGVIVAADVSVGVADPWPGGVPLMTGPLGSMPAVWPWASVRAKTPASNPVAEQASKTIMVMTMDICVWNADLRDMLRSLPFIATRQ